VSFLDNNEQLWAALDKGISLIQNNLPFVNYTTQDGLEGGIISINKFKNSLYVGTSQHLYRQNKQNKFEHIENTEGQNYVLHKARGKLLLANNPLGVFEIEDMKTISVYNAKSATFGSVHNQPDYLLTGGRYSLELIEYKQEHWHFKHKIKGFNKSLYGVVSDSVGNLWVFEYPQLHKLQLNECLDSVIYVEHCGAEKYGFDDDFAFPYKLNNGEVVSSRFFRIQTLFSFKTRCRRQYVV